VLDRVPGDDLDDRVEVTTLRCRSARRRGLCPATLVNCLRGVCFLIFPVACWVPRLSTARSARRRSWLDRAVRGRRFLVGAGGSVVRRVPGSALGPFGRRRLGLWGCRAWRGGAAGARRRSSPGCRLVCVPWPALFRDDGDALKCHEMSWRCRAPNVAFHRFGLRAGGEHPS
jgi:hypothetical protein